ncbi:MAG: ABC transporter substrate-binding protein [Methylocystis sp.]|jgi:NitT/TauT family transport system substrate-binding protein|nr:ABC transporter substrate-binding protein [Methylocystis sp.]MCA3587817.1 ABC transporter substrate-binding protein [Methylocystis sp.]MCA3592851.1 ABC transporter substrate-binding protein [Methylocystis sp.]
MSKSIHRQIGRRTVLAGAAAILATPMAPFRGALAQAQNVTFVQPSASAINSFPVFVAIGEGFFRDEGLNVRVESINGSGPVLQALASGQAQFGRPGPGPVLSARARNVDVMFIYNVSTRTNFGIVVREGAPYQKPGDLKGVTIGTGTADGAEVGFARNVLLGAGLKEGADFKFLTVGDGGPATAGFQRNDIQAYAASTADMAILNNRGMKVRDITPPENQTLFGNGIATMGATVRNNPDLVTKFGRAVARGHAFALNPANKAKVMAHLKAGMPQESEDAAFASALFDAVSAKTIPLDQSKGFGFQPPEGWADWHKNMLSTGDLKAPLPDLTAAYTNQFVAAWNAGIR